MRCKVCDGDGWTGVGGHEENICSTCGGSGEVEMARCPRCDKEIESFIQHTLELVGLCGDARASSEGMGGGS